MMQPEVNSCRAQNVRVLPTTYANIAEKVFILFVFLLALLLSLLNFIIVTLAFQLFNTYIEKIQY